MILKHHYSTYEEALKTTELEALSERRQRLCLNFAENCVKNEKTSHMFPLNSSFHNVRHHEKFFVQHANCDRLAKSAIPYLQRLLRGRPKKKSCQKSELSDSAETPHLKWSKYFYVFITCFRAF